MNIVTYTVTASLEVAVNTDSSLAPDAAGVAQQLQSAFAGAVQVWQDKLRGCVMVGGVVVTAAVQTAPATAPAPAPSPVPAPAPAALAVDPFAPSTTATAS